MITKANIKTFLRDIRKNIFCRGQEVDVSNYKYFIFINSKVSNIIDQVYPPFQKGFFPKDEVLIVYKHHFESVKHIRRDLDKYGLVGHCIINLRDIPSVENKIWFYSHNSMYNFSVINKNLYSKHVWIGHGDSEKIAYYKKMIRVFDYILVTGDLAIERFNKHKIFRKEESYKFIKIGKAALCSVLPNKIKSENKAILFASTWEGAMEEENYSTLHLHNENSEFIKKISTLLEIKNIVIKLHPNTGIRDSKLIEQTLKTIEGLVALEKNIIFIAEKTDWVYSWVYTRFQEKLEYREKLYDLDDYTFEVGVSNISAMASMLDAEGMKTFVLYDSEITIQERVESSSGKKIDLRNLSVLEDKVLFEQEQRKGLISYEKDWDSLSQEKMFSELIQLVNNEKLDKD
ncbi:MAG: Unknown protein [uncultured Sulfurovum sp.]|uniref:Uncharacterized protein n=1 Tax=uncultured Sulfurovum sp. TaxID=269237 RepID=A0A6S6T8U7_9BACT|nr:MAG: Unknown protein [uncultured Sulfurovum sp.]